MPGQGVVEVEGTVAKLAVLAEVIMVVIAGQVAAIALSVAIEGQAVGCRFSTTFFKILGQPRQLYLIVAH